VGGFLLSRQVYLTNFRVAQIVGVNPDHSSLCSDYRGRLLALPGQNKNAG
jgi:hypothetical protein